MSPVELRAIPILAETNMRRPSTRKRLAEPLEDTRSDSGGIGIVLDMAEEDGEFISADTRYDGFPGSAPSWTGTDAGAQPSGDINEQLIAGSMSEAVVDQFELVKVDEQDSEKRVLLAGGFDCGLEAVDEVEAVWKVSERVDDFAFGDIGLRTGHADGFSVRIADRDAAAERPDIATGSCDAYGIHSRTPESCRRNERQSRRGPAHGRLHECG